jgi:hypothetical protein
MARLPPNDQTARTGVREYDRQFTKRHDPIEMLADLLDPSA